MPELPEVEVCRTDLERWTSGRTITGVDAVDPAAIRTKLSTLPSDALPDGAGALAKLVTGARTDRLRRHGKRIGWTFQGREDALLLHLGMTGQWRRRPADEAPPAQARLGLHVDDGAVLWLVDGRRFGCVVPVPAEKVEPMLREGMGPDALLEPPDAKTLRARLRGARPLKVALMDQAVIAGVGNIHASEACWRAKVHPSTPCVALTDAQVADLARILPAQLAEFVAQMLAEGEHAYVNQGGPNPFSVYDREGEPCPRCGTPIATDRHGGRSTYFCPYCQPEPA